MSLWPVMDLVSRGDGEVRAKRQSALAERGCGCIVDSDQCARAVRPLTERGMSQTSIKGLLGDSIQSSRAPSSNSPCASPAVGA